MRTPLRASGAAESPQLDAPASAVLDEGPTWDLAPGQALGADRRIIRRIVVGRKTEIYLAWDVRRRSTVVAKLLRPGLEAKLEKLRAEADLLERLRHPVLVRGFEAVLDRDPPHIVLEHVEGVSLRKVMSPEGLPAGLVVAVGLQVATVLHYLAGEGLVHLDVKPHNILLGPTTYAHSVEAGWETAKLSPSTPGIAAATAKVIDLAGIKRLGKSSRGLGSEVPELRVRKSEIGSAAGVWLLGATMWQALPGGYKGRGLGLSADGRPAPTDSSVLSSDVPPALVEVLMSCLREDPAGRPSAEELSLALEGIVTSLPVPTRWSPRRRRWFGFVPAPRLRSRRADVAQLARAPLS